MFIVKSDQNDRWLIGGCLAAFLVLSWLSTGNLSPYANTLEISYAIGPCQYLVNVDYPNMLSHFLVLDGRSSELNEVANDLRRIGYAILAYPFMKSMGFYFGGVLANVLLNLTAIGWTYIYFRRKSGRIVGNFILIALVFNPAMYYWMGSPAAYNTISSFSLFASMLLLNFDETDDYRRQIIIMLLMGLLFLGYDIHIYFLPTLVFLIVTKDWRRIWMIPICLLPSVVWSIVYSKLLYLPLATANSIVYKDIVAAYILPFETLFSWDFLYNYLKKTIFALGYVLPKVYIYSNFVFYPLAFVAFVIISHLAGLRARMSRFEVSLTLSILLLFLFLNMTFRKQLGEWDHSGDWIARTYQPILIVFILYASRLFQLIYANGTSLIRNAVIGVGLFAILMNSYVVFGQLVGSRLSSFVNARFYRHWNDDYTQIKMIKRYGAKPIGVCKEKERMTTDDWQEGNQLMRGQDTVKRRMRKGTHL